MTLAICSRIGVWQFTCMEDVVGGFSNTWTWWLTFTGLILWCAVSFSSWIGPQAYACVTSSTAIGAASRWPPGLSWSDMSVNGGSGYNTHSWLVQRHQPKMQWDLVGIFRGGTAPAEHSRVNLSLKYLHFTKSHCASLNSLYTNDHCFAIPLSWPSARNTLTSSITWRPN